MILNSQRQPDFSLYYLGGVLLKILEQVKVISIEELLEESQQHLKKGVHDNGQEETCTQGDHL